MIEKITPPNMILLGTVGWFCYSVLTNIRENRFNSFGLLPGGEYAHDIERAKLGRLYILGEDPSKILSK